MYLLIDSSNAIALHIIDCVGGTEWATVFYECNNNLMRLSNLFLNVIKHTIRVFICHLYCALAPAMISRTDSTRVERKRTSAKNVHHGIKVMHIHTGTFIALPFVCRRTAVIFSTSSSSESRSFVDMTPALFFDSISRTLTRIAVNAHWS